jgi:hypothetical protein
METINQFGGKLVSTKQLVMVGILVALCTSIAQTIPIAITDYHLSKVPNFLILIKQSGADFLVARLKQDILFFLFVLSLYLPTIVGIWRVHDYFKAQLALLLLLISVWFLQIINIFRHHYLIHDPWDDLGSIMYFSLLGFSIICVFFPKVFSVIERMLSLQSSDDAKP